MKSRIAMMQLPSLVAMAASNRATLSSRDLYQSSEYDYQTKKTVPYIVMTSSLPLWIT